MDPTVAPVKLMATVLTLATGGSAGKEGPCAQIGASLTSWFADILKLKDEDRRRLVICGIGAGFAAVFGTPISGALFGIEVLYLGRIEYGVLFPCLVAGILAHLVAGVQPPVPPPVASAQINPIELVTVAIASGLVFGLLALLLIESMRGLEQVVHRFRSHPYLVACSGGVILVALYSLFGTTCSGLGTSTIEAALAGSAVLAFGTALLKIVATSVTLETGGSGGIVTPLFFIGSTAGLVLGRALGIPPHLLAAFGFVALVASAANTPIAAAVMAVEMLPANVGVYAALCACTAYLIVGHRSVYASQKLGYAKSPGVVIPLGGNVGDIKRGTIQVAPGTANERFHRIARRRRRNPES